LSTLLRKKGALVHISLSPKWLAAKAICCLPAWGHYSAVRNSSITAAPEFSRTYYCRCRRRAATTISKHLVELLLQHDLRLGEVGKVDDHQQVLQRVVEHFLELGRIHL